MAERSSEAGALTKAARWVASKVFGSMPVPDGVSPFQVALGGGYSDAGVRVDSDTAMRATAVWGCVRVLAETMGCLPVQVYERGANGEMTPVDHPLMEILAGSPNANMTPQEVTESQMTNLSMMGNSYSIIDTGAGGRVTAATPIPSPLVAPRIDSLGMVTYQINDRGKTETLPAEKVWHIKGFGSNGLIGLSPVGYARQAIGMSLATEAFGAKFFQQGASTTGIVTAATWLTDKQRGEAKKVLEDLWHGMQNAHKVQMLEGGLTYTPVTMPLEDAQFLETRKFQTSEICRIYRVPPHMIADLERATFTNIEQQSQDFLTYTLLPYLTRFEQTISKRLLSPADRRRYVVKYCPEGLLRADSAARSALYGTLLANGVYSRNEVRRLENMPRSEAPGMDDFTVQSAMTLIQLLEQVQAQRTGGQNG